MLIDLLIILFAISAVYRGREIGFVRQVGSTIGFFGGLFLGAWLEPRTVALAHTQPSRALVTIATTLGCALILLTVGEYVGLAIKHRVILKPVNKYDNWLGSVTSVVSLLFSVWLIAAIIGALPFPGIKTALRGSWVVSTLNRNLPPAPNVIADIGRLIDPNGFPQVFTGHEPIPRGDINLPNLGELQSVVNQDHLSVVKVDGQGCGGIVEGSGFVVGADLVATNAHVVAGIRHIYVEDANGTHTATAIWFDPNVDFAVLKVNNLAGAPLTIETAHASSGTPGAVLGYPGGGGFDAVPAAVMDEFTAVGRNIYGSGLTSRDVYELQAEIIPGNSGGPLINAQGQVIGVVFAQSTTYNHVGYALTTSQIAGELNHAKNQSQAVGTGQCAD